MFSKKVKIDLTPNVASSLTFKIFVGIFTTIILSIIVSASVFRIDGGEWFDVKSPSMGTAATVGTLILTKPATVSELKFGDIITYHPNGDSKLYYTHRIIATTPEYVLTKGDNNNYDDPWKITQKDLVGKSIASLWGVGWLMRMVPWLLLGWGILILATSKFKKLETRISTRIIGASFVFTLVAVFLQPFVGLQTIGSEAVDNHVNVNVVAVGIMPIKVSAEGNSTETLRLYDGEKGTVKGQEIDNNGRIDLNAVIDLGWKEFALVIAFCLIPLGYSLFARINLNKPRRIKEQGSNEEIEAENEEI